MCAVKNRHFPLFIRFNIINNQDIKRQFIQSQFSGQGYQQVRNFNTGVVPQGFIVTSAMPMQIQDHSFALSEADCAPA